MFYLDSKGKRKVHFITTGIIILSALLLAIVIPQADITLTLQKKIFKQTYEFSLKYGIEKPLLPLNILPAYPVDTIEEKNYILIEEQSVAIKKEDMLAFITSQIEKEIDETEKVVQQSLIYTLQPYNSKKQQASIYVETDITQKIDINKLKATLVGKNIKEAEFFLQKQPFITYVQITQTPKWLPFLPFIKERITIVEE